MNRKMISHGLIVTAIVVSAFIAAALTPAKSVSNTSTASALISISESFNRF